MKSKIMFSLIVVIVALSAIGIASANENTTETVYQSYADDTLQVSEEPLLSESDSVDLSVKVSPNREKNVEKGDIIEWTITVEAKGGTAYDTKVRTNFYASNYISHKTNTGTYDKNSKVWSIGNLSSGKIASLTIKTEITTPRGTVASFALATASSDNESASNSIHSYDYVQIKVVGEPVHVVTGSGDTNNHEKHYFSSKNSKRSGMFEAGASESIYKTAKADSSYKSVETGENLSSDSDNLTKENNGSDYDEGFSIRKAVVYLSENIFSVAIVALAVLIGVVYYIRRD